MPESTIIYTHTDEAPALATYSLLPVVQAYASTAGVRVETRDISLAGRIIASFPELARGGPAGRGRPGRTGRAGPDPGGEHHQAAQRLGVQPQLKAAIAELQSTATPCPTTPTSPTDRRGTSDPGPLRQGDGQRGQPGAPPGQLRPPGARLGQELRPDPPSPDGGVVAGLADQRGPHGRTATSGRRSARRSVDRGRLLRIELVGDDGDRHGAARSRCRCWPARSSTPR